MLCRQLRWLRHRRRRVAVAALGALLVAEAELRLRLLLAPPTTPPHTLLKRPPPTVWNVSCPAQAEVEVATTAGAEMPSLEQVVGCSWRRRRRRREWRRWGAGQWVLTDWAPALRRPACLRAVTLTTHADLTYMPSLGPLVRRWRAPVSLALHAPGDDLEPTLHSIAWARACLEPPLVARHVSFHVIVDSAHAPHHLPPPPPERAPVHVRHTPDCSPAAAPWLQVAAVGTFRRRRGLPYPINVARNVARDAARTHFVLPSDVELLPSAGLSRAFLAMVRRQPQLASQQARRVFVLPVFEVGVDVQPPDNKTQLVAQLRSGDAAQFHEQRCPQCQMMPWARTWVCTKERAPGDLGVTAVIKIRAHTNQWEPIFIGTHREPPYDERLSWEGMRDKFVQMYIMCLLRYEFHILDNAFLVHQPGVKSLHVEQWRDPFRLKNDALIESIIKPEITKLFGARKYCFL